MENKEIKKFITNWLESQEDSLDTNENGFYLYSCGASTINLPIFLESLLEDFIESEVQIDINEYFKNKKYEMDIELHNNHKPGL